MGACIRRNEHTLQSVSLLKSGKFPAFFVFLAKNVVKMWSNIKKTAYLCGLRRMRDLN